MAVNWEDDGIVLAVRRHGEHDAIITLLTERRGRHAGLVKGGAGTRQRSTLQSGNLVKARWRARLDDQLGTFTLEALRDFGAGVLSSPPALAGLTALCAMAEATLPEREAHADVYRHTRVLLEHLGHSGWEAEYVRWELALLRDMGYGLDLTVCAATGSTAELEFVSPRSGRAVSRTAAAPYLAKLLALPAFLCDDAATAATAEVVQGLALTGHFFETHFFGPRQQTLPAARTRFVERLQT